MTAENKNEEIPKKNPDRLSCKMEIAGDVFLDKDLNIWELVKNAIDQARDEELNKRSRVLDETKDVIVEVTFNTKKIIKK